MFFGHICKTNKPGPSQVGAPIKFLEYAKDTVFKLSSLPQCRKITQKDTHKIRKPLFLQLETQKPILQKIGFSRKSLTVPKKELSAQPSTFSQAEISYPSARVSFNQMNVSKKIAEIQKKYDKF